MDIHEGIVYHVVCERLGKKQVVYTAGFYACVDFFEYLIDKLKAGGYVGVVDEDGLSAVLSRGGMAFNVYVGDVD